MSEPKGTKSYVPGGLMTSPEPTETRLDGPLSTEVPHPLSELPERLPHDSEDQGVTRLMLAKFVRIRRVPLLPERLAHRRRRGLRPDL